MTKPKLKPKRKPQPKKEINPPGVVVENLASIGCTEESIATVLGICAKTIRNRFSQEMEKGREGLKISLRRKQIQVAYSGNVTMLIFLGKQYLSQSDKLTTDNTTREPPKQFNSADLAELRKAGMVFHDRRERIINEQQKADAAEAAASEAAANQDDDEQKTQW